jgi:hypothetical protein
MLFAGGLKKSIEYTRLLDVFFSVDGKIVAKFFILLENANIHLLLKVFYA